MRLLACVLTCLSCIHLALAVAVPTVSAEQRTDFKQLINSKRSPNSWRGVRVYFSYHGDSRSRLFVVHVVGGMRIKHHELTTWLETLTSGQISKTPIGFQVANAFYRHLLRYLDFNGFDINEILYQAEFGGFDNPEYRGVVGMFFSVCPSHFNLFPCNFQIHTPTFPKEPSVEAKLISKMGNNVPRAWCPLLLDAIRSYFTDPARSPAYPVTLVRVPDAYHHNPDPLLGEFQWPPDLFDPPPGAQGQGRRPLPTKPWRDPPPGPPRVRPKPGNYITIGGPLVKRESSGCDDDPKDLRDEVDLDAVEPTKMERVPWLVCKKVNSQG